MTIYNKEQSKIKMCVLRSGKNQNITWYSIISKDNNKSEVICQKMLNRFKNYLINNPTIQSTVNKINFYQNGVLIGTSTI